jgi:hypothetical protein
MSVVNEGEAFVAEGDDPSQTARDLLAAAEAADLDPSVVKVAAGYQGFIVPDSIAPTDPVPDPEAKSTRSTKSSTDKK